MNSPPVDLDLVTIDLLRHGEVEGGPRYRGSTDDALTSLGNEQMHHSTTSATTSATTWDYIISSPLQRCSTFARELSESKSIPLKFDERAKEIYFGEWEGKTTEKIFQETPELIRRVWQDPVNNTPPQGETLQNFKNRVREFLHDIATNHKNQHLLIITHAGIIRVIIHNLLGTPLSSLFNINVPHACMSQIKISTNDEDQQHNRLIYHSSAIDNSAVGVK